ncbi:MAG: glycosyltransferase [Candidatus Omnitrophica bacterium]|nr:glycosyltransferase [Candidatus Omnitrophota bacterium]
MKCDIVIAVWNLKEITQQCIESIIKNTEAPYRLILVDDASQEPARQYLESLREDKRIGEYLLIRNETNLGATKSFNRGMQASSAEYVVLLNNDTLVTAGWLTEMIAVAESAVDIGIVNPASNNLGQHPPKGIPLDEYAASRRKKFHGEYIEMATAVGFCYLMKRRLLDKIGLWNEQYGLGYFEETEHCIRARQNGYRIVMAKGAYVYHYEKSSFKLIFDYEKLFEANQKKFREIFGKSPRLLYIFSRHDRRFFYSLRDTVRRRANDRGWVHVFKKYSVGDPGFGEHTNIKVCSLFGWAFGVRCLWGIVKKKKRYDEIYVDDEKLCRFLRTFSFVHRGKVEWIRPAPCEVKILDVGCGGAKLPGALGIDMQAQPGVDIVCDLNSYPWPLNDNSFDILNCNNVMEHVDNVLKTMEELHRIGKNGAVILIDTCHFSHPNSYRDPTHKWHFTSGTFDYFTGDIEYPRYSDCKFKMLKKELRFKKKYCRGRFWSFFSVRRYEKYYCHRCPADGLYFELEIVK